MLLILLFLTAPLAFMPEAALSAIVFLIGVGRRTDRAAGLPKPVATAAQAAPGLVIYRFTWR